MGGTFRTEGPWFWGAAQEFPERHELFANCYKSAKGLQTMQNQQSLQDVPKSFLITVQIRVREVINFLACDDYRQAVDKLNELDRQARSYGKKSLTATDPIADEY